MMNLSRKDHEEEHFPISLIAERLRINPNIGRYSDFVVIAKALGEEAKEEEDVKK